MALITVNSRGVPVWAILASTVVGFLCVIAAYVSPDTVFLFLLNSSGAVILFVYLLIAISQYVLRRQTPEDKLTVKMWFFPYLTIVAALGIVLVATGIVTHLAVSIVGVVIVVMALFGWALEPAVAPPEDLEPPAPDAAAPALSGLSGSE